MPPADGPKPSLERIEGSLIEPFPLTPVSVPDSMLPVEADSGARCEDGVYGPVSQAARESDRMVKTIGLTMGSAVPLDDLEPTLGLDFEGRQSIQAP